MARAGKKKQYFTHTTGKRSRDWDDPEYVAWRCSIRRRDKCSCQMPGCPYVGSSINCHHIQKWADSPLLRYAVDNGICLCYDCHKKIKGQEEIFAPLFMQIVFNKLQEKLQKKKVKDE